MPNSTTLIQYVEVAKDRLNVTFGHKDSDIERMIIESMASIRKWVGPVVFNPDPKPEDYIAILVNDLLLNLVRYKWNGSGQYFIEEYRPDILSLQIEVAKNAYQK